MKKSELLKAIREEIHRHNLDTFMNPEHKIVETGCSTCQKHFGTIEQFKQHLTDDVLPPLLDKLSGKVREIIWFLLGLRKWASLLTARLGL